MASVHLRGPLKQQAGGRAEHAVEGTTVAELLRDLEAANPAIGGWILDERGRDPPPHQRVRQRRAGRRGDRGRRGRPRRRPARDLRRCTMTELLVGTKKGLFALEGDAGRGVRGDRAGVRGRAGRVRDARPAHRPRHRVRDLAVLRAEDVVSPTIRRASGSRRAASSCPRAASAALERIWAIVPRRGRRPAVRRRRSRRAVREPRRRRELGAQPRPVGAPDPAGLAAGRRRAVPALDRHRGPASPTGSRVAISAAGVWLTDDGGDDLAPRQPGPRRALPARGHAARTTVALCVHDIQRAPQRGPSACSCSSTAASTAPTTRASRGTTSANGLPSDFGFPLAVDPADPDSAYVIPLTADIGPRHARTAACASTRRATPARAGRRAATACRPSTRT